MENLEKKLFKKRISLVKKNIIHSMKKNNKYWSGYYNSKNKNLFLDSKLDRMRYYLNTQNVKHSIEILKNNINNIIFEKIQTFLTRKQKSEFLYFNKKKFTNFENLKMIFVSKSLIRYYLACGYNIR